MNRWCFVGAILLSTCTWAARALAQGRPVALAVTRATVDDLRLWIVRSTAGSRVTIFASVISSRIRFSRTTSINVLISTIEVSASSVVT